MTHEDPPETAVEKPTPSAALSRFRLVRTGWVLAGIVAVASGLRGFQIGRLSFWYDEVVTMRLARAGSPGALVARLFEIDATRAPLHPLLLEAWLAVFGSSEAAARSLSVLCGIATVFLIFEIGRIAFDASTGLWAAWLAALSPLLIVYSREARMYAWLVLVTCLCWRLLLDLTRSFTAAKAVAYVVGLTALVYSHPLGLLMWGTLALAGLIALTACSRSWRSWLAVHLAVAAFTAPWIGNYLDHPPEYFSGPQSLRSFLGMPIGFIGGDSRVLVGLAVLIAWGVTRQFLRDPPWPPLTKGGKEEGPPLSRGEKKPLPFPPLVRGGQGGFFRTGHRPCATRASIALAPSFLLLWLILAPSALYLYSRLAQPIFGPPRYTIFVAPAYLILVALGLGRSPTVFRYSLALGLTFLAARELGPKVYDSELKADWRGFAAALAGRPADRPGQSVLVIVASSNPLRNVEVETARYYLRAGCVPIALEEATPDRLDRADAGEIYLTVGSRRGRVASPVPERIGPYRFRLGAGSGDPLPARYPGLTVWRAVNRPAPLRGWVESSTPWVGRSKVSPHRPLAASG
jgi:hypothetical protein